MLELERDRDLEEPHDPIGHASFLENGIASTGGDTFFGAAIWLVVNMPRESHSVESRWQRWRPVDFAPPNNRI